MIIERKYVPFCMLAYRDKEAWAIFEKAFNESYSVEDRDRIWAMLRTQCLAQKDSGWCFLKLGDVIEGFEKLDLEKPYDNGFTYKDVNETRIVSRSYEESEEGLTVALICRCEDVYNVVKFVSFEDSN